MDICGGQLSFAFPNVTTRRSRATIALASIYQLPASPLRTKANTQHSPDDRAPLPLAIHHNPLCLTFAYFEDLQPILDPTHLEETLASGTMTVTLNAQRELCVLSKAGGSALSVDDVMAVVRVGVERVRESVKRIEEALVEDAGRRIVEVR